MSFKMGFSLAAAIAVMLTACSQASADLKYIPDGSDYVVKIEAGKNKNEERRLIVSDKSGSEVARCVLYKDGTRIGQYFRPDGTLRYAQQIALNGDKGAVRIIQYDANAGQATVFEAEIPGGRIVDANAAMYAPELGLGEFKLTVTTSDKGERVETLTDSNGKVVQRRTVNGVRSVRQVYGPAGKLHKVYETTQSWAGNKATYNLRVVTYTADGPVTVEEVKIELDYKAAK